MKSISVRLSAGLLLLAVLLTTAISQEAPSTGQSRARRAASNDRTASDADDANLTRRGVEDRMRLDTNMVNVMVSVTDAEGRFITGLMKDHFEVYDDGVKQEIAHLSADDSPLSLGIVFDVSASMKDRLAQSIRALGRFIETSHKDDDYFLIAFNDQAKLVQDFTSSGESIASHLTLVEPRGETALYDAAYLAVEKVAQGRHGKKALLIISDGQDNNSRYSYKELRSRVQEADVAIYAIGITDSINDSVFGNGRSILQEITRMTGGRAFFPGANNESELIDICTRIALELRRRYWLAFYPTDYESDNRWHRVEVRLTLPKGLGRMSIAYRDSYQSFGRP